MFCKNIQQWIIESSERNLRKEQLLKIEQHVSNCKRCADFEENLNNLRNRLKNTAQPDLPSQLFTQTWNHCMEEIASPRTSEREISRLSFFAPIPKTIWIAILALTVLTGMVLYWGFKDFSLSETLSFPSAAILTLLLQNVTMLVFAPILLDWIRNRKPDYQDMIMDMNGS